MLVTFLRRRLHIVSVGTVTEELDLQGVIRSSIWLYLGVAIFNIAGFLYWIVASVYVSPDVIGSTSAILSIESLVINVLSFGVPIGVRRYIGSAWGRNAQSEISSHLSAALIFSLMINIPASLLILLSASTGAAFLGLSQSGLLFLTIIILLDFWPGILASLFISILKTQYTTVSNSVSSISKLLVGAVLLHAGFGLNGVFASIILASVLRGAILAGYAIRTSRHLGLEMRRSFDYSVFRDLLGAGSATWIPNTLMVIGQTLGVLLIFGTVGANETGLYYIAFAVSTAVYNLSGSVQSLMFPVLSGMSNGRRDAVLDAVRLSLAITAPIALILVVYPFLPFMFLGATYSRSAEILFVLVLGALFFPIVSGYSSYVYAAGEYRHVIAIDLTATTSRLALYFLLVPVAQGFGAGVAYISGVFFAFLPVAASARNLGFQLNYKKSFQIIGIPSFIALLIAILPVPWFLGAPLLLMFSAFAYARLRVVTKSELRDMALAFLSPESVARVYQHTKRIVVLLFGD